MSGLSHMSSPSRSSTGALPAPRDSSESVRFGEFLRHAREHRGLTIQQISYETKIPSRHLDALELGRLFEVPGGAYRRGEIIAYAKAVGLDRRLALDELERVMQTLESPEPPEPMVRIPVREPLGLRPLLVVGLIGGAIVAVMMWRAAASDDDSFATTAAQPSAGVVSSPGPSATADKGAAASPDPAIGSGDAALEPPPIEINKDIRGELVIASEPPGARVTLDGIGWGSTPLTIRNLPPGAKEIRVTKDGYAASVRVVRLEPDTTTRVSIPLRKTP
jgi:PEGA domain-containing protein/helix-turn-helix protein